MVTDLKKNNFDTLRLLFATLVIYSHSFPVTRGSNITEPLYRFTGGQVTFGMASVWSFFIISGFLITQSWVRSPNAFRFLRRRISRIFPGFVVATLLCAVIVHPIASPDKLSVLSYVRSTLHLQMFVDNNAFAHNPSPGLINASLWSISVEFWFYIVVLVLGLIGILRKRFVVLGILATILPIQILIDLHHIDYGTKTFDIFMLFPLFLAGSLAYLFSKEISFRLRYAVLATLILFGSLHVPHATIITFPILGAYLVMWLAYLPALNHLHLGRWGDFSYGTYLYAYPIQQLLALYYLPWLNPLRLFLIAAPLSILAGILSWHLVEKHFLLRTTVRRHEAKA